MGLFAAGEVVLLAFPFSDLSQRKLRPAVLLASAERNDWIACQVTSNKNSGHPAVQIQPTDFIQGGLRLVSYARPAKLFTANESLFVSAQGTLAPALLEEVRESAVRAIRQL